MKGSQCSALMLLEIELQMFGIHLMLIYIFSDDQQNSEANNDKEEIRSLVKLSKLTSLKINYL